MRYGFIRDAKDIKYLVLYCLSFMPFAVTETDILDMVLIDDAFGYFEFSQAFHELLETRHVAAVETDGEKEFILTPQGHEIIRDMYRELPLTVRDKAERAAMRVVMKIRRDAAIKADHSENPDGTFTVHLKVCDQHVEHLSIDLMVVTQRQCAIIEENFKRSAENIYRQTIQMLSDSGQS